MFSTKPKFFMVFLMLLMAVILFTACNTNNDVATTVTTAPTTGTSATTEPEQKADPMTLQAGSASVGGANYLLMSGWTEIINENTSHRILNESTGGSMANMDLIMDKVLQIGVTAPVFMTDEHKDTFRALHAMHTGVFDGVALEKSGIRTLADLQGKYVSIGPAGGVPAVVNPKIMDVLGYNVNWVYLGQGDSISALQDNQIDAALMFGGIPRPAFEELDASHNAVRVGPSKEEADRIVEAMPEFEISIIPKDTYSYLEDDEYAVEFRYAYIVHKDVPEQVVYEITKATIENWKRLSEVHASLDGLITGADDLANVRGMYFHPGAIRAYREAGIEVHESTIPPEM